VQETHPIIALLEVNQELDMICDLDSSVIVVHTPRLLTSWEMMFHLYG
jgi:hypothetical protein